jgi:crotonobetainyl-CoA:carnitine CoA-transferase CaiB-like acyl-CoA transferase
MAEVWEHEQLKARSRWTEVRTPAGKVPALLPPGQQEDARMEPVPALGEHSDAVLLELGLDDAEIAQLRAEGAI